MNVFYSDQFVLPLPPQHRFPMQKYALLMERVVAAHLLKPGELQVPPAATDPEVLLAHASDYLQRLVAGQLTDQEVRRIGFPWSSELVERERLVTGATIAACRAALADGVAVNLAGGTHHAFRDHGAGYCVFNDSAVAALAMLMKDNVQRVSIIDVDVHQGDGTAAILADDPRVFTFSIHGRKNYPFHKQQSDLDIALDDDTDDAAYLAALQQGLSQTFEQSRPDLMIYVAGADPYVDDALGRLAVSKAGLAARDELVLDACYAAGVPVAISMAGGYARNVDDTVDIHFTTVRLAMEQARR